MHSRRLDRTDVYLVLISGLVTLGLLTAWSRYEKDFQEAYEEWVGGRDDR